MSGLPKLCLNMIVKNESHIIEERLEDLTNKIHFDYYVICDTGSTDNTKEIIRSLFEKKNIPGELHEHEWSDFGTNNPPSSAKPLIKTSSNSKLFELFLVLT